MRKQFILLTLLLCAAVSASARVSVNIGIHVPVYPRLVLVPSYPVYYAPDLNWNYFFYDGLYWVYQDDGWYSSEWYDGPWDYVEPEFVPYFILRVPVRYYRLPPRYFIGWHFDAPPRWHIHWGSHWASRHRGWDHWDRRYIPAPAPLPVYQRDYSGNRYPRHREQQHQVHTRHYDYRPREASVRHRREEPRRDGRHDARQESGRQQSDRGRRFSDRNDSRDTPRQLSASPERQPMSRPQTERRAEQRERRVTQGQVTQGQVTQDRAIQNPNPARDRQPRTQQPRQQWDGQPRSSQRQSTHAPQQREQRQLSPSRSHQGNERSRGNGQERSHQGRNHDRGRRGN